MIIKISSVIVVPVKELILKVKNYQMTFIVKNRRAIDKYNIFVILIRPIIFVMEKK